MTNKFFEIDDEVERTKNEEPYIVLTPRQLLKQLQSDRIIACDRENNSVIVSNYLFKQIDPILSEQKISAAYNGSLRI